MPAHFVLKRYMPGFEEYGDLYEAIKTGRKKVEYRDATPYWELRLLSEKAWLYKSFYLGRTLVFRGDFLKHDTATFVVGYTSYPRLIADITKIVFDYDADQFQVHLENVKEETA